MLKADVVAHFGSIRAVAEKLGISTQSVYAWGVYVPDLIAYKIQVLTDGELVATGEAECAK